MGIHSLGENVFDKVKLPALTQRLSGMEDSLSCEQVKLLLMSVMDSGRVLQALCGTKWVIKEEKTPGQPVSPADVMATVPVVHMLRQNPNVFKEFSFAIEEDWAAEFELPQALMPEWDSLHSDRWSHRDSIDSKWLITQDAMDGSGHICGTDSSCDLNQVGVMIAVLHHLDPRLAMVYRPFVGDMFFGNGKESFHSVHGRMELPEFDPRNIAFHVNRASGVHQHPVVQRLMNSYPDAAHALAHSGSVFAFTEWLQASQQRSAVPFPIIVHEDHSFSYNGGIESKRGDWDKAPEWTMGKGLGLIRVNLLTGEELPLNGPAVPHALVPIQAKSWVKRMLVPQLNV